MVNPAQAQRSIRQRLEAVGIEAAQLESRLLVEHVLKLPHPTLFFPDGTMTQEQLTQLENLTQRRCQHEPLQYLLGSWEFFGLEFLVGAGVLIPRQDTETLVETVLPLRKDTTATCLLDLCSGSGCIPAAIAAHLACVTGDAVELSEQALPYLRKNLKRYAPQMQIHHADALYPHKALLKKRYDIITCNPPYLTAEDMAELQPEVAFEPETALYGGDDGLTFYHRLTPIWKTCLKDGGWLVYEVGMGQGEAVRQILERHGMKACRVQYDLCGIDRVVLGKYTDSV